MSKNIGFMVLVCFGYAYSRQLCPSHLQCLPLRQCGQRTTGTIMLPCNNGKAGFCCRKNSRNIHIESRIPDIPQPQERNETEPTEHRNSRLLPKDCGTNSFLPINKIDDGEDAFVTEYPWIVYISLDGEKSCSGTIISKSYILTAGHCVSNVERSSLRVFAGMEDTECTLQNCPLRQKRRVKEIIVHEKFRYVFPNTLQNDIALLRLQRDLNITDEIRPVCLPLQREARKGLTKNHLTLLGWGFSGGHKVLQRIDGDFVPYPECATKWKTSEIDVRVSQICIFGRRTSRATRGDSGGPLQMSYGGKGVIVGITSYGPQSGFELPFVLVKVAKYLNWILDHLHE